MPFQSALLAVVLLSAVAIVLPLAGSLRGPTKGAPVRMFFHGGGVLKWQQLLQLLLSSSFSLNAVFYALWLGYHIGAWALLIQLAWGVGYLLVMRFNQKIRNSDGLHQFLNPTFGRSAVRMAAVCSLLGIMFMIGWEFDIARGAFAGLFQSAPDNAARASGTAVAGLVVAIGVMYSVAAGLRGNARVDLFLNAIKVLGLLFLCWSLLKKLPSLESWFPNVVERLGWLGLATTLLFNLAWQFVDSSSWMSLVGTKNDKDNRLNYDLKAAAIVTFFVPGVLGALLGMALMPETSVNQGNIFLFATVGSGTPTATEGFLTAIIIAACMLSLLDGLFLAAAGIVAVDLPAAGAAAERLDADGDTAERNLTLSRVALIAISIAAIGMLEAYKIIAQDKLFDFVFVVVIPQLALLGPVLAAFGGRVQRFRHGGLIALLAGTLTGFVAAWFGTHGGPTPLLDAAGTISGAISCICAFAFTTRLPAKVAAAKPAGIV